MTATAFTLAPDQIGYMIIGVVSTLLILYVNRHLYRGGGSPGTSALEAFYYAVALAALGIGWYFNIEYLREYRGEAGWWHWTTLLFVNPASASGGQDLIFGNLVLFPLWTILDGRRRHMKMPWLYFPISLVTSYAFAFALFLAIQERHLRAQGLRSATPAVRSGATLAS
jgi:hypothetical protein